MNMDDVAGYEKTKKEIKEAIEDRKNLFLFGPPGCGKTYTLKATCMDAKVERLIIDMTGTIDCYLGPINLSIAIPMSFDLARKKKGIIVFDHADIIAKENKDKIKIILKEMETTDIMVVATAYNPWTVDPTLMGKFARFVHVPAPDLKDREEILKFHSKKKSLAVDVNFKSLAELTEGYSCSDLRMVAIEATDIPWKEAFHVVKAKTEEYIKRGLSQEEAEQKAGAETTPRTITMDDFEKVCAKQGSGLTAWYRHAKEQIKKKNFTEAELKLFKEFLDDIKKKA